MMPQRFLLAVPRELTEFERIERVSRASEIAVDHPALWCDSATRIVDLGRRGVVLGPVFQRGASAPSSDLDCDLRPEAGVAEFATHLVREYWGAYLAILIDSACRGLSVLSDPSGLLPVYRAETERHVFLTSDPLLFAAAGMAPPSVSWSGLRAHLLRQDLRSSATCLAGVRELQPGALVPIAEGADDGVPQWRPDDFMPRGPAPGFEDAATALRSCAIETISAWASLAGPVAVAASGGVDSSLICAALAEGGHAFDCVTLATTDPSCDERAFVRALTDHLGVRCIAATYDAARVDPLRPSSAGLARPSRKTFMQALDAALDDGRKELGAAAVFDGNGGDSLFCFVHSSAPVLDCLAAAGLRPALTAFIDMCGVTGCDVVAMAGAVMRRARRGGSPSAWLPDLRLLSTALPADRALDPLMPWLDAHVGPHRGKRDHLSLLMHAQNHVHSLGGIAVPRLSPLLSQPMVELCISLPTWLWCSGGINRAPARAAFADVLPPAIRRRTSKAGPDSFIRSLLAVHQMPIRDLLLGGRLADHGLIDCDAVATALETDVLSGDAIVYRLLDLVEAETWARSWGG